MQERESKCSLGKQQIGLCWTMGEGASIIGLAFEVVGIGSDTQLKLFINDQLHIDAGYTNTITALDEGHVGLGRKIKYDNFYSSTDIAPAPVPSAFLLGILGLGVASNKLRRRRTA